MKSFSTFAIFIFVAVLFHCKILISEDISDAPCHIMNISDNGRITISNVNRDIVLRIGPRKGYLDGIGELNFNESEMLKKFIKTNVKNSQITGEFKKNSTLRIKYYKKDQDGAISIRSLSNDFTKFMKSKN